MASTKTDQSFAHGGNTFWALTDGHIKCEMCNNFWCGHIRAALLDNADSTELFSPCQERINVEIAMVPSLNLWTKVCLYVDTRFPTVPTYQVGHRGMNGDRNDFIGFINEGEGRFIIREMIFDWFRGAIDLDKLLCQNASHKYKAQMNWVQHMKDSKMYLSEYWAVWMNGACLTCLAPDQQQSDDDLIPDPGKGRGF